MGIQVTDWSMAGVRQSGSRVVVLLFWWASPCPAEKNLRLPGAHAVHSVKPLRCGWDGMRWLPCHVSIISHFNSTTLKSSHMHLNHHRAALSHVSSTTPQLSKAWAQPHFNHRTSHFHYIPRLQFAGLMNFLAVFQTCFASQLWVVRRLLKKRSPLWVVLCGVFPWFLKVVVIYASKNKLDR